LKRTLHLSFPTGQTLLLAVLVAAAVVGGAELVLRQHSVRTHLPAPSVASSHMIFEIKLELLREAVEEDGPFDCLFLGSSIVNNGLDPAAFEAAYRAQTGQDIRCFNFGINGGGEDTPLAMAEILVEEYHPTLLVFGLSPRLGHHPENDLIIGLPWVRYRRGDFSLKGWLADRSMTYRYGLLVGNWLAVPQVSLEERLDTQRVLAENAGFNPSDTVITLPLGKADLEKVETYNYRLDGLWQKRLDRMLGFHQPPGLQVVLVEVPVHPVVLAGRDAQRRDYEAFVAQASRIARERGVLFLPTTLLGLLPDDASWRDKGHLNSAGAAIFSRWVGEQVGRELE
jgi:hypothetical protein